MKTTVIHLYEANDAPFFTSLSINHDTQEELETIMDQIADVEDIDEIIY